MKRWIGKTAVAALAVLTLVGGALLATAQQEQGTQPGQRPGMREGRAGGQRGQRGERPQFDPARFREMRIERYRESLDTSDEEWKAIKPLIEGVVEKQDAVRMTAMRRMFGRRGFGGRGGDRPGGRGGDRPSPFGQASPEIEALEKALESKETPAKDIEAKLKALRDVRKKAEQELKSARDKLRQVLTIRQEAQLVLEGLLD